MSRPQQTQVRKTCPKRYGLRIEAVLGKRQDIGEGVDDDRQGPGSRDFGEVENFHFAQATGATETPSFSAEQSQYRVERSGRAVQ